VSGAIARETQRDSAHRTDPSVKAEIDAMWERMRGLGFGDDEIAAELSRRYRLRPRKAYRITHGWTLTQAAARLNARAAGEGTDPEARASHKITDITGSVEQLRAEFHGVSVFGSDEGVLHATVHGCTYDAYLASQLRAQLEAITVHVIGMPEGA
jgi:hypothetical protein